MIYPTRKIAGWHLARMLKDYINNSNTEVMGLVRGGLVTAKEVAEYLNLPLKPILVAKIGHPSDPEFALGAVAIGGRALYDNSYLDEIDIEWLEEAERSARRLLEHRLVQYHLTDQTAVLSGKTVILVDDGMATGLTMQAAVLSCRDRGAGRVIVAVPVASKEAYAKIKDSADEIILLDSPDEFLGSVGAHYANFEQVNDKQAIELIGGMKDV